MNLAIYRRVSSKRQLMEGESLEGQCGGRYEN